MSQVSSKRAVASCGSCGEIHTVEVRSDGSVFLLGRGLTDRCPCGDDGLEVLSGNLDVQPTVESGS